MAQNNIDDKIRACETKILRLQKDMNQRAEDFSHRQKMAIVIRSILLLVAIGYMGFLYNVAKEFTADSLTDIGMAKASQMMPGAFTTISDKLKSSAPQVLNQLKAKTLALPNMLRSRAEEQLDQVTGDITKAYAQQLETSLDQVVEMNKHIIATRYQDKKIDEAIPEIAEDVSRSFREVVNSTTEFILPQYVSKLDELNKYLITLLETPDSMLSKEQKLHKEMISTWVSLTQLKDFGSGKKS